MLQMLSKLCCTDRPIQIIPLPSLSDLYGENEPKTRSRGQLQQKWQPNQWNQWVGVMNDATDAVDTMLYWSSNPNYTITVTVWSIRRELAKNEKQGPTTTEMTAKSVKSVSWSHEWCYRCCQHYAVLIFQFKLYHHRHRLIYTERTSQEREAGANYNRNDSQISEISELESWMMLQMLSTLCCTVLPIQIIPLSSPSDLYGEN